MKKATQIDLTILTNLAQQLWPHHTVEELKDEFSDIIEKDDAAFFLAYEEKVAVGFAQCQLRYDYVEGTSSTPVGYLEGIYIKEEYRKMGFAKKLLADCEAWAKEKGCKEFASDCELENGDSLQFHLGVGFMEANRIICFTKKIAEE